MAFYNYIIAKIRNIRYSMSAGFSNRLYTFGAVYHGAYLNYKHDPQPLIFCMYGGPKYTHTLQIHYMDESDRAWLARTIFMIKKYNQNIDGYTFYKFLKTQRMSIVKKCYRVYFTDQCKFKMVSAGFTPLDKLAYPSNERFVRMLNEVLSASNLTAPPTQVAYSQDELRNRIIESMNSVPIEKTPLSAERQAGVFGKAKWIR